MHTVMYNVHIRYTILANPTHTRRVMHAIADLTFQCNRPSPHPYLDPFCAHAEWLDQKSSALKASKLCFD